MCSGWKGSVGACGFWGTALCVIVLATVRRSMTSCFHLHARAQRITRLVPSFAAASVIWLGASVAAGAGGAAAAPVSARSTSPAAAAVAPPPVAAPPAKKSPSPAKEAPASPVTKASPAGPAPAANAQPAAPAPAPVAISASTSATDGVATIAPTTSAEKRAAALSNDAMNKDFLALAFEKAEKKLRKAIQICLQQSCSVPFRSRLNRDIGVVYIVGMNRIEDGKDEFAAALLGDPTVAIAPEMITDEVEKAFLEVKRGLAADANPTAAAPEAKGSPQTAENAEDTADEAPTSDEDAWRDNLNWLSLGIQQDFLVHSATKFVCNDGTRYRCYDGLNQNVNYTLNPNIIGGNEIKSAGIKVATLRVLVGYERLLSKNFSIGLKLGMLVYGKSLRLATDRAVLAFHGEGRLNYYPGAAPFAPSKLMRPYVFLSGGLAEIDGRVSVDIYERDKPYARVVAWKRTGRIFVGLGAGLHFALAKKHGPFVEGRFMRMMEKSSFAAALQAGYAYGF